VDVGQEETQLPLFLIGSDCGQEATQVFDAESIKVEFGHVDVHVRVSAFMYVVAGHVSTHVFDVLSRYEFIEHFATHVSDLLSK
jgi:hypothetical protein